MVRNVTLKPLNNVTNVSPTSWINDAIDQHFSRVDERWQTTLLTERDSTAAIFQSKTTQQPSDKRDIESHCI